jgi:hypothetical protein
VSRAESREETLPVSALPGLIDELADLAGEYFASIAALSGAAYKMEMNLARFYRSHLGKLRGGSHLPLVAGFEAPVDPGRHAVASLRHGQYRVRAHVATLGPGSGRQGGDAGHPKDRVSARRRRFEWRSF